MGLDEKQKTELYKLYRLYSMDFDMALHTLGILRKYPKGTNRYRLLQEVRYCLLRDAVVSYVRPFSGNRGILYPAHSLKESFIPKKFLGLHKKLIQLRLQLFAHTDLAFKDPKVVQLGKFFPISIKAFDYESLSDEMNRICDMVSDVQNNLEVEIRALEAEHLASTDKA